jgi:hypothetical protein
LAGEFTLLDNPPKNNMDAASRRLYLMSSEGMGKPIRMIRAPTTRPTPQFIIRMSFQLAIPWRVALQHCPPPLHQLQTILTHAAPNSGHFINRLQTATQSTQGWVNDHENPWVNDCENLRVVLTKWPADDDNLNSDDTRIMVGFQGPTPAVRPPSNARLYSFRMQFPH